MRVSTQFLVVSAVVLGGSACGFACAAQVFKDLSFIGHGGAGSVAELEAANLKTKQAAMAEAEAEETEEPVGSPAPALAKL